MAAIDPTTRLKVLWVDGNASREGVFRVGPFNNADTLDLSTYFAGALELGAYLTSQSTDIGVVASSSNNPYLTLTTTASTQAIAYLLCRGQASTGYSA